MGEQIPALQVLAAQAGPDGRRPVDHEAAGSTWAEFMERAAKASAARQQRGTRAAHEDACANLLRVKVHPTPERRCTFIHKSGERCKLWMVRGATRCHVHGGLRQVPEHPAVIRHYRRGTLLTAHKRKLALYQMIREVPPQVRQSVRDALRAAGWGRISPAILWDACKVWMQSQDDGGRAWRRHMAELKPLLKATQQGHAHQQAAKAEGRSR